jgi:hypothetical protein
MKLIEGHAGNAVERAEHYHSLVSTMDHVASAGVLEGCLFRAINENVHLVSNIATGEK